MADNILHSPGIKITETDKSFVPARPLIAGAAIIGPTAKGAAYAPTVCTSYGDYERKFGTTFMMNRYAEDAEEKAQEAADAITPESVTQQLEGQYVQVQEVPEGLEDKVVEDNQGNKYVPYLDVLQYLEGGETIYVMSTDEDEDEG